MPGLDTTATSDISFMLLIFFLVTTSMNSDWGMGRRLPPPDQHPDATQDIDKDMVLTIAIGPEGTITTDGKPADAKTAERAVSHFIITKGARHVIELQVSRSADYDTYFHVQNAMLRAYRNTRDAAARKRYGHTLDECNDTERDAINAMYPQRIKETVMQ